MSVPSQGNSFLIGNLLLGLALAMLFFLGPLWQYLGVGAMVLWMALAGAGFYLVTRDQSGPGNMPD